MGDAPGLIGQAQRLTRQRQHHRQHEADDGQPARRHVQRRQAWIVAAGHGRHGRVDQHDVQNQQRERGHGQVAMEAVDEVNAEGRGRGLAARSQRELHAEQGGAGVAERHREVPAEAGPGLAARRQQRQQRQRDRRQVQGRSGAARPTAPTYGFGGRRHGFGRVPVEVGRWLARCGMTKVIGLCHNRSSGETIRPFAGSPLIEAHGFV